MATMWLKDHEPGKEPKKFMDKKAVKAFLSRKDEAIAEAKRQLQAANWAMAKLDQQIKEMSEERKWLFLTIFALALFLVIAGVVEWL